MLIQRITLFSLPIDLGIGFSRYVASQAITTVSPSPPHRYAMGPFLSPFRGARTKTQYFRNSPTSRP